MTVTWNTFTCQTCGHTAAGLAEAAFCNHQGTGHAGKGFRSMKPTASQPVPFIDEFDDEGRPLYVDPADTAVWAAATADSTCNVVVRRDRGAGKAAEGQTRFYHEPCGRPAVGQRCERHVAA